MAVSRQKNAAFTLVELLVVITVLGILMGLLLPAVNMVRESMRRTQCKNNLKQIGDAAQSHLTQYGFFPSAGWGRKWLGDADKGTGGPQPGGWTYQLLPFMGLDMIHDKGKLLGSGTDSSSGKYAAGAEMRAAAVANMICPTRRRGISYPDYAQEGAFNAPTQSLNNVLNKTDYAANSGTLLPQTPFDGPPTSCYGTYPNCTWDNTASAEDGVIYQASQMTPANITDGLGNTFLAGEKSLAPDNYTNGMDPGDNNSMLQGYDQDNVRWCAPNLLPAHDSIGVLNTTYQFGGPHFTGVQFVFCDGSARNISYQIDATIYRNLGCRNDGVVIENF